MEKTLGILTLTKEIFIKTMELIETQYKHDQKCHDAFKIILPNDYVSGYNNDDIYKAVLDLLKIAFNDDNKDSWIDYYIYELDFGKKYKDGSVTDNNGSIPLANHQDLWNLLNNKIEYV